MVDRPDHRRIVGDIYLGRVDAVLPGIQAAFVDIGLEKSAFLHASDLLEPDEDDEPSDKDEDDDVPDQDGAEVGIGINAVEAKCFGYRISYFLIIAGGHIHLDTRLLQPLHGFFGIVADAVG